MAVIRGLAILLISVVVLVVEIYFIIIEPLINGVNMQITSSQYWAIAIPVFVIVGLLMTTTGWIGYTMITTPEPVRFDYEEAYEVAKVEIDDDTLEE